MLYIAGHSSTMLFSKVTTVLHVKFPIVTLEGKCNQMFASVYR